MLRLCFYHPRITYMKWKKVCDAHHIREIARHRSRCLLFPPKADIDRQSPECPLCANSGHSGLAEKFDIGRC